MDVMNAAAALCVLCHQGVNVKHTSGGPLHFPFSPSLPLLLSILTWSMISASLLRPPVPSHGTRSPANCLVPSSSFFLFSIPKSNPILLSSHRRGSLAANCCVSPQRHGSVSPCVSDCDSLIIQPITPLLSFSLSSPLPLLLRVEAGGQTERVWDPHLSP